MGTGKICVAVNNRAPHQDDPCNRLWRAVCGLCPPSRVSAQRSHLDGGEGQFRGSILVQDKAVLSPRFTPARNAGREYGLRGSSAVLHHLLPNIRCHHFLSAAIKSAMSSAKTAIIAATSRYEKCHQAPFRAIFWRLS